MGDGIQKFIPDDIRAGNGNMCFRTGPPPAPHGPQGKMTFVRVIVKETRTLKASHTHAAPLTLSPLKLPSSRGEDLQSKCLLELYGLE
ncbi:unnamed protein product [Camellia sinensis]